MGLDLIKKQHYRKKMQLILQRDGSCTGVQAHSCHECPIYQALYNHDGENSVLCTCARAKSIAEQWLLNDAIEEQLLGVKDE